MRNRKCNNAFTLVELLVALIVTSIVTAAVVTLAQAMNSAGIATGDTSRKQAQVRFAALRISDLIGHCRLVCYASADADEVAVWAADDNADGKINIGELTYVEAGSAHNRLRLYTFTPFTGAESTEIKRDLIGALATNWWTAYASQAPYTALIPQCSNVTFYLDAPASPVNSRTVSITFDVAENGFNSRFQTSATLRARAGNLLDVGGNIVSDDD